uniref:KRAB domain-containing protein n=1 Tax=Salvator merianae TaxID=96440 RepID=A0A8D0DZW0_SALMN
MGIDHAVWTLCAVHGWKQHQKPATGIDSAQLCRPAHTCWSPWQWPDPSQTLSWQGWRLVVPADKSLSSFSFQPRVTFEEVTVHFTDEEWPLLHSAQRALHREIMEENYRNVASLVNHLLFARKVLPSLSYKGLNP